MDKKRLFRIMAKADAEYIALLAKNLKENYAIVVVKEPEKTLVMVKMREPVKQSLFYIGEVMVSEAIVEIDGTKGIAVAMGDDYEKTLDMAIIDAACNKGIFDGDPALLKLEKAQMDFEMKENAMHMKTMVNFNSMDSEVPQQ
jgi:alpha-D-ribose 1-methylphosphonate 5-triphosphate synthase subunit PhnG